VSPALAKTKQSAKQVATSYFAAIAKRDVDAMMELWEPGGYADIYGMVSLRAPEGHRAWFGTVLFRAFPDLAMEVIDMVAYGEKAAVRWRATGTFTGPVKFEGLEATGTRIEIEGLDLLTIRDGLIRDNRAYTNATEIARQLGAMPPAGSVGERAMLRAVNLRTRARDLLQRR
jgi:predicted ester cyclase